MHHFVHLLEGQSLNRRHAWCRHVYGRPPRHVLAHYTVPGVAGVRAASRKQTCTRDVRHLWDVCDVR